VLNIYKPITYAESNGIGITMVPDIKQNYHSIKPFLTTNTSKNELVQELRKQISICGISIPTRELCPDMYKELGNYTFTLTKSGLISYHHPPGGHDDYVDSLAIANYAYDKHNVTASIRVKRNEFYK
jgi:hypothetical protein